MKYYAQYFKICEGGNLTFLIFKIPTYFMITLIRVFYVICAA